MSIIDELQNKLSSLAKSCGNYIKIKEAIDVWCEEFEESIDTDLRKETGGLIEKSFFLQKISSFLGATSYKIRNFAQVREDFKNYSLPEDDWNYDASKESELMYFHNYWLFVFGFFIVAVIVAIKQLKEKGKLNSRDSSATNNSNKSTPNISSYSYPKTKQSSLLLQLSKKSWIAVLVVSVSHQSIIGKIKSSRSIPPEISDELCKVTKALWVGEESKFFETKLYKDWLKQSQSLSLPNESDFDVYLIQVEFKESELHPGLRENEKLSSRLEAFRWLSNIKSKVIVTPRLSDDSFTKTEVYRR